MVASSRDQAKRLHDRIAGVPPDDVVLTAMADDIDQVTFVIGSIAEQTKILALNAAVEVILREEKGKSYTATATRCFRR